MIDQDLLAEVAAVAQDCDFPCSKEDIIECAQLKNVPDDVIDVIDRLPDRDFLSETDIIESVPSI